ncbi:MAG: carbohydrate kinase family protein [Candidatus Nitrosocaldaceae archaeon]
MKIESFDKLSDVIKSKLYSGGSIRGIEQREIKGGNATNIAYALSMLGMRCVLITAADEYGKGILENTFANLDAKLIIKNGKQGYTTSFETKQTNIMISDSGINEKFSTSMLSDEDLSIIKGANAIAITNWASNICANELIEDIFSISNGSLHFLDPADISERKDEFVLMLKRYSDLIDVLSINENEGAILAKSLGIEIDKHLALKIAKEFNIRVDLHTQTYSASSNGSYEEIVDTFKVDAKIFTGAGDVWDAADILAYLADLEASKRLLFANAAAAYYVQNVKVPKMDDVLNIIEVL